MSERRSGVGKNAWFRSPPNDGLPSVGADAFLYSTDKIDPLHGLTHSLNGSGSEDKTNIVVATTKPRTVLQPTAPVPMQKGAPTADDAFQKPEDPDIRRPLPFDKYPET